MSHKALLLSNPRAFFKLIDEWSTPDVLESFWNNHFPEILSFFPLLEEKALSLHSSVFFSKLLDLGFLMDPNPLAVFKARNPAAINFYKRHVNLVWNTRTALCVASSRQIVHSLIDHGADTSFLLTCNPPPHPKVLRWTLEYAKDFRLPAEFCLNQQSIQLEYVRLLLDFEIEIPKDLTLDYATQCALFTFGRKKVIMCGETITSFIEWNIRTHHFYSLQEKTLIRTALLVFKRHCPRMPRDIRCMILGWVMNAGSPLPYKRRDCRE
jgi:hypothetical protein